jgi:co-chaperonin GroES (HSP10)
MVAAAGEWAVCQTKADPYRHIPFEALQDYVLIEPIRQGQSAGGIAIPEGSDIGPAKGIVVKVGPGRYSDFGGEFIPTTVKAGEIVYLHDKMMHVQLLVAGTLKPFDLCKERMIVGTVPSTASQCVSLVKAA